MAHMVAKHRSYMATIGLFPKPLITAVQRGKGVMRKHGKIKLTVEQEEICEVLGMKAGYLARQMFAQGIDLKMALNAGVNPFSGDERPKYMKTVCSLLLQGGFTKKELKRRLLEDHPEWSVKTAESHVTIVVSCLPMLGVVAQTPGERYIIK